MIIDLHCDLPAYLALDPKRTPFEPVVRCSHPQLKAGGVKLQVMAAFTETEKGSQQNTGRQLEIIQKLPKRYPQEFKFYDGNFDDRVSILGAIENASGLCGEEEPLEEGLKRLDTLLRTLPTLYISLTWNGENRFGGGAGSDKGLKEDGKRFLEAMSGRKVALDFSHASDNLARDALNTIDKHGLNIPVMASHSNFRAKCDQVRNLPDDIAREIFRRNGVIGLVLYTKFVNPPTKEGLLAQIEHGLKLGGEKALAFGSDFFCIEDFPELTGYDFIEGVKHAGHYLHLTDWMREKGLNPLLFSNNAQNYVNKIVI